MNMRVSLLALFFGPVGCSTGAIDDVDQGSPPWDNPEPLPSSSTPTPMPSVIRTVSVQNPLGGPVDNLMADGDFELSAAPDFASLQSGWLAFSGFGTPWTMRFETGGLCRSGLRCGVLEPGAIFFGRGTAAANGAPHQGSLWVKPLNPDVTGCNVLEAYLLLCDQLGSVALTGMAPDEEPGPDGWCEFRGDFPPQTNSVCMYVQSTQTIGSSLLDSATLFPGSASGTASSSKARGPAPRATQATRDRATAVLAELRRKQRFDAPSVWVPPFVDR